MSLLVWLPLNGTLDNYGVSANLIKTSDNTPVWRNEGKIGAKSLDLGEAITFSTTALANVRNYSMMCWCKIEDNTANTTENWLKIFLLQDATAGGTNGTIRFESCYGSSARFASWHNNGTNATYAGSKVFASRTEWGKWHHLCVVFGDTYADTYFDGTLISHLTGNRGDGHLTGVSMQLGATNQKGCMNDVRIYDTALSAAEVKEIAQGLVLHYKLDSGANLVLNSTTSSTKTLTADGNGYTAFWYLDPIVKQLGWLQTGTRVTVKYDFTATTVSGTSAYCYSQLNGARLNPIISQTAIRNGSGTVVESFSCTEAQATYAYDFCIRFRLYGKATESLTVSNVQIYIGDGVGQIIDSSGYGYHGTLVGIPTISSNTPRYSASISFNGTTDSVNAGKSFEVEKAQAMTFSCWVYTDNWTGTNQYFISSQENGGFLIRILTDKKIRARINAFTAEDYSTNGYVDADATISTLNNSEWHLLTGVYNTSSLKLYIDGELKSTKTSTTYGLHFNSSTNLFLAAECAGSIPSNFCACTLSDIRIYYTALSDDAVRQLYEVSAKIDKEQNWHTFECIEDSTTNIEITTTGQTRTVGTLINSEYYDGIDEISAAKVQLKKTNKKINAVEFIEI